MLTLTPLPIASVLLCTQLEHTSVSLILCCDTPIHIDYSHAMQSIYTLHSQALSSDPLTHAHTIAGKGRPIARFLNWVCCACMLHPFRSILCSYSLSPPLDPLIIILSLIAVAMCAEQLLSHPASTTSGGSNLVTHYHRVMICLPSYRVPGA